MSTAQSISEKQAKFDSGAHLQRLHMAFRQDYHTRLKNAMTICSFYETHGAQRNANT